MAASEFAPSRVSISAEPKLVLRFIKKAFLCSVMLFVLAKSVGAAVTPISVGSGGIGPITFDTLPGLADGWATASRGINSDSVTSVQQLDAAVQTNSVAAITNALGTDLAATNSTVMFGNTTFGISAYFRWNSPGHFLESRASGGNAYSVLMATLANNSGQPRSTIVIHYDYGLDLANGATTEEDDGGNLGGHRVYYSQTGTPGSWVHIPEFDVHQTTTFSSNLNATINLATPWEVSSNLYIMWIDENAVVGSTGLGGAVEGPNALDNFALDFLVCQPSITSQPHSVTVNNCTVTNLSVTAFARAYQWFKDGSPISGATNAVYEIPSATGPDTGSYFVRAMACDTNVDSEAVAVTVEQTEPKLVSALVQCDLKTVVLTFSQRMDPSTAQQAESYELTPLNGGLGQTVATAVLSSNGTVLTLTLSGAITPEKNYKLVIQPNVSDCAGSLLAPISDDGYVHFAPNYELCLLALENEAWKYYTNGGESPLGTVWRLDPAFDDSSWADGVAVFDAKTPSRNMVSGFAVMTQLPLFDPNYAGGSSDIPVYLFRTHFSLPVDPANVLSLNLFSLSDDFDVCWINNHDTPAHIRLGFPAGTNVDQFYYSGGLAVDAALLEGPFVLDPTLLKYGDNLVCAKAFNANAASSDITFGYELLAVVSHFGPLISIDLDGTDVHLTWQDGTMHLYEADAPDALPNDWTWVEGQMPGSATVSGIGGQPPGAAKFYSLRE